MLINKQHIVIGTLAIFSCYAGYSSYQHHQQVQIYQHNNKILQQDLEKSQQQIQQFQNTYSEMYFKLNSLTVEQFEARVAKGDKLYVYIGRPDCSDCNLAEPTLIELIDKYQLANNIFYVNVTQLYQDKAAWLKFKEKYHIKGTPVLMAIDNTQQVNKIDKEELNHFTKADILSWLQQNNLIRVDNDEK